MLINEAVALSKKKDSIAKSFEFNKRTLVKILSKQNKTKANGEKTGGSVEIKLFMQTFVQSRTK